jgi:class 3 adenylate cyclase/tetratricopeptide (TPR) repeat protein
MDLDDLLRSSGLEQYKPILVSNAIDIDVLPDLTEEDLERLGIPLGDRKRLLKTVRKTLAPANLAVTGANGRRDATRDTGERRHLTIMICDLVESTALSARIDPEDLRAVMDAYHAACSRICIRYEGFISGFRGDGILAYFGYPRAHEDDAERAVRAALEINNTLAQVDIPVAGPLKVRIGLATGLVVVRDVGTDAELSEHSAVGDTPNVAARLQGLGDPGAIVIAASTRRLLGDLFRLRDLGRHHVKGFAEPLEAWLVEGLAPSVSRFGSIHAGRLTDFVGRGDEIEFLLKRQRRAWSGEEQVVLITGEPGIGKSRLAVALAECIPAQSYTSLTLQCSPHHTSSALHPIIAYIEREAGFNEDDSPSQRIDKLECLLSATTSSTNVPLFASLLSIPLDERHPPLPLSASEQRHRTLAALLDHLEALARQKPVLLLFEDAQWADATSLELLEQVAARAGQLPLLMIITMRPGAEHPWLGLPNVSTLAIARLEREHVKRMVTQVADGRDLPAEVMKGIVAKTDGNPLFIEELTKTVLESGILVEDGQNGYRLDGPLPSLAIPSTLQDSLMARLDRLEPMKRIAQVGAAIGREFTFSLLRAVVGASEPNLLALLGQLELTGLVFRRGEPPEASYIFKHALIRDAAYESLLKSRRQQLHHQIARAFEKSFPAIAASEPEIVAHHLIAANLVDPAIDYLLKAGTLALNRSANAEAVEHLSRGINLAQQQPASPERARKELEFYLALGPALAVTDGHAAPTTLEAFSKARDLLGGDGTPTQRMTVLWGTLLAHNEQAEHTASLRAARECLALAEEHRHPGILAMTHRLMGQTLNHMGALAEARAHLERTISLCAANDTAVVAYRKFGLDDQVGAMFNLARNLLLLGYPDQSAAEAERAVARARSLELPYTTAQAMGHAALVGLLMCDTDRVAAHVDGAISHSARHGLLVPEQQARFIKGALLAQTDAAETGLDMMRAAMATGRNTVQGELKLYRTLYRGYMADAHLSLGEAQIGLDLLRDAIADAEATGAKFFYAELFRLQAKMLLALGERVEAESSLHTGLAVARSQEARWWELRAATSLAKLWHSEGRTPQARSVLQPVYDWFSEGFETTALREARSLLVATEVS